MPTQQYEIEAWLGDNHGLTAEQVTDLTRTADEIAERYPDPDDRDEREVALTVAYRLMIGDDTVVDELAADYARGRAALAGLRHAAITTIPSGAATQAGFARRAGVDRMAVRGWLGKR